MLDELLRRHPSSKEIRKFARRARKLERKLRDLQYIEGAVLADEEARIEAYLAILDETKKSQASANETRSAEWSPVKPKPDTKPIDI